MTKIIPIILSGGSGERLWPASRRLHPKPLMKVAGKSLLMRALEHAALVSDETILVTNNDYYFHTEKLIQNSSKAPKASYLLEPEGRNTAPAIALAVRYILEKYGEDAVCLVLAADHLITDKMAFERSILKAAECANSGNLVVFGVRPTAPETGYGYIEVAESCNTTQPLKRFVEKPDRTTAELFVAEDNYYWNSGMFCFTAGVMAENIAEHAKDVWGASKIAFDEREETGNVCRFNQKSFLAQPNISIDYAVMENARNVFMVPVEFGWSDVGTWDAVARLHEPDIDGNRAVGFDELHFIGSRNNHVENLNHVRKTIAVIGVQNLVIVDTPDALLVADRDKSQDVKLAVEALKETGDFALTEVHATVYKPWGDYTSIKSEEGYQVKRISVAPGEKLSLQYHHQRAEHWIVIRGEAKIQIGDKILKAYPGDHCYIPLGEKHRLTNIGDSDLLLIEVQFGSYLGEDDIVRLEDIYGRHDQS